MAGRQQGGEGLVLDVDAHGALVLAPLLR
jgi:hypothetical protein